MCGRVRQAGRLPQDLVRQASSSSWVASGFARRKPGDAQPPQPWLALAPGDTGAPRYVRAKYVPPSSSMSSIRSLVLTKASRSLLAATAERLFSACGSACDACRREGEVGRGGRVWVGLGL